MQPFPSVGESRAARPVLPYRRGTVSRFVVRARQSPMSTFPGRIMPQERLPLRKARRAELCGGAVVHELLEHPQIDKLQSVSLIPTPIEIARGP
jgi:hypothetical protein